MQGLVKTEGGYMLPGNDPKLIKEALKRRKSILKPPLSSVKATLMSQEGRISIIFDQPIMLPTHISQLFWDVLLEVSV